MSKAQDLPMLSAEDIELKVEEVISYFDEKHLKCNILKTSQATPLLGFMEILQAKLDFEFNCKDDLGLSANDFKILGAFTYKPEGIHIDKSLDGDKKFPFVLGHELGHFVLHRKYKVDMGEYNTISDTEKDFKTGKKRLRSLRDWMEWQANRFASAIILPRATITESLIAIQRDLDIKRHLGKIYLEKHGYSLNDYHRTLNQLADCYKVNKKNVECRLKDLNILIDRRDLDINHISALLKEEKIAERKS